MPWDVENYYIVDGRMLRVEITIPLMEFLYTKIEDVKDAWLEMLNQFVSQQPGIEVSWEMQPRETDAIVTVQIAKSGELGEFTDLEAKGALDAVDALFDDEKPKKKKKSKATKKKVTKKKKAAKTKKKAKASKKKKK